MTEPNHIAPCFPGCSCLSHLAGGPSCATCWSREVAPATCAPVDGIGVPSLSTQHTNELIDLLVECWEYFDNRADVVDGDYGEPRPNKAMSLGEDVRRTLARLGHDL